jgi:hypothetical protein
MDETNCIDDEFGFINLLMWLLFFARMSRLLVDNAASRA